ncbi:MAG: Uma2 family endonuclease [Verrucomicrobia bacterium]|nr:Uma2 family endonuclease [Cytophagales bacterium]
MEVLVETDKYSVAEFLALDTFEPDFTYELLNGEIVQRSSPHHQHQTVLFKLAKALDTFISEKKSGILFIAPVDVYLDEENYVVPDLIYLSEAKKVLLTEEGYVKGSPDIIMEVLSPATAKHDKGDKMKIYRKHQIPEYWLIDTKNQSVEVYVFRNGDYDLDQLETGTGTVKSAVLQGFTLEITSIFS